MNPKLPELDPKEVTKQMLLTCKIFRKRNTNVTPLKSHRNNQSLISKRVMQTTVSPSPNRKRVNAAIIENPPKQSLDEYLDNMSMDNKARTAI